MTAPEYLERYKQLASIEQDKNILIEVAAQHHSIKCSMLTLHSLHLGTFAACDRVGGSLPARETRS